MDYKTAALGTLVLLYIFHSAGILRATLEGKKTGRQMAAGLVFIVGMAAALYMASTTDPAPITQIQQPGIVVPSPTPTPLVITGYSVGGGLATP